MSLILQKSKTCRTPAPPKYNPCGEPATGYVTLEYFDQDKGRAELIKIRRSACDYHRDENLEERKKDWYRNNPNSVVVQAWEKKE